MCPRKTQKTASKMFEISRHLIPVKLLLFFLFGAFGCLWPFLSVHMKQLGLTMEETAIVNMVSPFVGLLGPPLACLVATKTGRSKSVLIGSLIVCAIAFTALLYVPPSKRHPIREPRTMFECDMDGGRVTMERCGNECKAPIHSFGSLVLNSCHYACVDDDSEGPGETAPNTPYICVEQENGTYCDVYNASGHGYDIVLTGPFGSADISDHDLCTYPMTTTVKNKSLSSGPPPIDDKDRPSAALVVKQAVQCRIENPKCSVRCKGYRSVNDPLTLRTYECQEVDGHPLLTFASYLLLRTIAEFFVYAALVLVDATMLNSIWEFDGLYSQQLLCGLLSIGLLSPIVGLLVDNIHIGNEYMTYAPAFIAFDVFIIATIIVVASMPSKVHSSVNRLGAYLGRIMHSAETVTLFIMVFLLGVLFGFLETFYYWFLDDKRASAFFLGMTLLVGIFPSLPLLFFGDRIVRKCCHANILIAAFFAYLFRCVGYAVVDDYWHFLPFETFKMVGNYLMWIAAITYAEKLGPKLLTITIAGTVALLHNNAGRGIGALAGGFIMSHFGAINAFRVAAIFAGVCGVTYLALYHFYLKFRRCPIYIETSLNGHYTPMETYTNGENQAQKPMLANQDRY